MGDWAERRRSSEELYNRDPARYAGEPSAFAEWALAFLAKVPGSRDLIEVGAGPGRDARRLAEAGYRVRAVEIAPTAVARAEESRRWMREPARSRLGIVEAEAGAFLHALPAESQDVVYANLSYHGFSAEELNDLFGSVHRVLRPGGHHLYCVRDTTDPYAKLGECVGPETRLGGPHEVAFRYFTVEYCAALRAELFDPVDTVPVPAAHVLYVADRRRASPPERREGEPDRMGRLLKPPTSSPDGAAEGPAYRGTGTRRT